MPAPSAGHPGAACWLGRARSAVLPPRSRLPGAGILATDPDEAQRLFAESLAALDKVGPIAFEQARTLLCSGEAMRRNRRPVAAREPLREARILFEVSARDHGRLALGPN